MSVLSELPKFAWSACQRLPNKNSKEILFFHQSLSGLMHFEEFQNEAYQIRNHLKNHKERIPKGIIDLIDRYLEPLYYHI
jgi:hypothetical protein